MRGRSNLLVGLTFLVLTGLVHGSPVRAAETDPYYAWLRPPGDSTTTLNRKTNEIIERALREVNRGWFSGNMRCVDVARAIMVPFTPTTMWFFVGGMDSYELDVVPRSNTEYRDAYAKWDIYRYSRHWKWGFIVPPDPTLRVHGVHLSPDKLGHFFHEGWQYYEVYLDALERGLSEREAHEEAIWHGIREENMIQGDVISGIFSYADLEANEQGFLFYRRLCDDESPLLVKDDDGWRLTEPFDFRAYVNPCWDESYYVSAFSPRVGEGVQKALLDYCPVREHPRVQALFESYEARGCASFSYNYLEDLAARGEIPDRTPYTIHAVCSAASEQPQP